MAAHPAFRQNKILVKPIKKKRENGSVLRHTFRVKEKSFFEKGAIAHFLPLFLRRRNIHFISAAALSFREYAITRSPGHLNFSEREETGRKWECVRPRNCREKTFFRDIWTFPMYSISQEKKYHAFKLKEIRLFFSISHLF